jgi:hypothetical protein
VGSSFSLSARLEQHLGIREPLVQAGQPGQLRFQVGQAAPHLLRPGLVSPQAGVSGPLAQVSGLGLHAARIEHRLDAGELRGQCGDLIGGIGTCHAGKPTRGAQAVIPTPSCAQNRAGKPGILP